VDRPVQSILIRTTVAALLAATAIACSRESPSPSGAPASTQRANPATENCIALGGRHTVEHRPDGGEFDVCLFEDNLQCEEWALLRGLCPAGGRRVTGYATEAARFCAISGGRYVVTSAPQAAEAGDCFLSGGDTCSADAYFAGTCP
jgi:putative hemolysin